MKKIAEIRNDFKGKFGIPRQSGIADKFISEIVFEPEFRVKEALRGIEGYSHLWLIWEFSEAKSDEWSPTVRPPRLGGNKRMGVFATRSPYRPNSIGLSSVKLLEVVEKAEVGCVLRVVGADLMDRTPILDIKPYLAFTDSHPDAVCGFADEVFDYSLEVDFPARLEKIIPEEKRDGLRALLASDPRPAYVKQGERVFTFSFAEFEISFTVSNDILTVTEIEKRR